MKVVLQMVWTAALGAVLVGCSTGTTTEENPLFPVTGTVQMDGKPAAGVRVLFRPQDSGGTLYSDVTDAAGKYTLQNVQQQPGAAAGNYCVSFSRLAMPDGSPIPEGQTAADVGAVEQIPPQYSDVNACDQFIMVSSGGGTFNFDISSR